MKIFTQHIPDELIDGNNISKTCGFSPKEITEGIPNPLRVACALAKLDTDCDDDVWLYRRAEPLIAASWLYPQYGRDFRSLVCDWTFGRLHNKSSERLSSRGESVMNEIVAITERLAFSAEKTIHGIGAIYFDAAMIERVADRNTRYPAVFRIDSLNASAAHL